MEILQECTIATLTLRTLDKNSLFALERKENFFIFWFYCKVSFSVGFVSILTVTNSRCRVRCKIIKMDGNDHMST